METPLGLNYRPIFPVLHSIFKEVEQKKALQQKAIDEANKVATQRINESVRDLAMFNPDYPVIGPLQPFMQTRIKNGIDLAAQIKSGKVSPDAAYKYMAETKAYAQEVTRKNAAVKTTFADWDKSGEVNMSFAYEKYGETAWDLTATRILGTPTALDPFKWSQTDFMANTMQDSRAYNKNVLAERFMSNLHKVEDQKFQETKNGVTVTTNKLSSKYFNPDMSKAGIQTLNMGDEKQSAEILNFFMNMGPRYKQYLEVRSLEENPEFANMKPNSDEWGTQMQKSLKGLLSENGQIGKNQSIDIDEVNPDKYDPSRNGGSLRAERNADDAADIIVRTMQRDPSALGYYVGGDVEKAEYVGGNLVITKRQRNSDGSPSLDGTGNAAPPVVITIPLTEKGTVELINRSNEINSMKDWVRTDVEKAVKKRKLGKALVKSDEVIDRTSNQPKPVLLKEKSTSKPAKQPESKPTEEKKKKKSVPGLS